MWRGLKREQSMFANTKIVPLAQHRKCMAKCQLDCSFLQSGGNTFNTRAVVMKCGQSDLKRACLEINLHTGHQSIKPHFLYVIQFSDVDLQEKKEQIGLLL